MKCLFESWNMKNQSITILMVAIMLIIYTTKIPWKKMKKIQGFLYHSKNLEFIYLFFIIFKEQTVRFFKQEKYNLFSKDSTLHVFIYLF